MLATKKSIPRNSDCPCGSRKKYKKCCYMWKGKIRIIYLNKVYAVNIPKPRTYRTMRFVGFKDTVCNISNLVFRAKKKANSITAAFAIASLFVGQNWRNFDEYRRG